MFKIGFTLSEILITLVIIGVIAAMVIPALNNQVQDMEYKTAYKKSFSELSQIFAQALAESNLPPRTSGNTDTIATSSEWTVMKDAFKVAKTVRLPSFTLVGRMERRFAPELAGGIARG